MVKAFNNIGREVMHEPVFGAACAIVFTCDDDAAACDDVAQLARGIRFEPLHLGPLTRARNRARRTAVDHSGRCAWHA